MPANHIALKAIRRQKCGLRALERQTGISRGFLSQIENGKRGASDRTLAVIAEALQIPVETITLAVPVVAEPAVDAPELAEFAVGLS